MRVLIVEDEGELAAVIARVLDRHGFAVDVAASASDGLRLQVARDYDVLVLDRTLPDGSGDDVCRRVIDSGASTKVLMLTARDAVAERWPASSSARTTTSPSRWPWQSASEPLTRAGACYVG